MFIPTDKLAVVPLVNVMVVLLLVSPPVSVGPATPSDVPVVPVVALEMPSKPLSMRVPPV